MAPFTFLASLPQEWSDPCLPTILFGEKQNETLNFSFTPVTPLRKEGGYEGNMKGAPSCLKVASWIPLLEPYFLPGNGVIAADLQSSLQRGQHASLHFFFTLPSLKGGRALRQKAAAWIVSLFFDLCLGSGVIPAYLQSSVKESLHFAFTPATPSRKGWLGRGYEGRPRLS